VIEQAAKPPQVIRRLSAVLFVDVVDSVRLIQQDPDGVIGRWRTFVAEVSHDTLPSRRGRIVKLLGDGMLVEFGSASDAVDCGLAFQARIERMNDRIEADRKLHLRVGIHLADVLADELDLYGDGVNLAARLMGLAGPGETIISAAVRDQVTDGLGLSLEDLGERWLKGMERPVRAFRVWPPGPPPLVAREKSRLTGGRPSIAVLPFRNLSADPAHAFLGDMLAEDLIGALSRQTDMFVISRLSTTPFRNRLYEPRNVAEVLGVRYVLSGTMQTSETQMRLMAELTEAETGRVIWAERFDGSLANLFDLQDQLSRDISERVVPFVRQQELQRARSKRPESLTAYERTLHAIDHIHRSSPESLEYARQMLEAAIESDPRYAAPHAWLALYYVRRVGQGWSPNPKEDTQAANRYAATALERDESDPWTLSVNGLVEAYLNKNLEIAIGHYDRALTINPSAAPAWAWSTTAYAWLGRGEEATRRAPRAIELSPLDPNMYAFTSMAGMAYLVAADYETALDYCRRSMRQNRMFSSTHRILTITLALSGRMDEASEAAKTLLVVEPGLTVEGFLRRFPGAATPQAQVFGEALRAAGVPP
jgi:TolB-like protein/class 3 adenylate cyclase